MTVDGACETQMAQPLRPTRERLDALDALRGFIMIFMAVDHTVDITTSFGKSGSETWRGVPAFEPSGDAPVSVLFATRFVTGMCAPGFCLLMGVSMPFFQASREKAGWSPMRILKFHLIRALVLFCPCHVFIERIGFELPRLVYSEPGSDKFRYLVEGTSVLFTLAACMALSAFVACGLGRFSRRAQISAFGSLGVASYVVAEVFVHYIADKTNPTKYGWFIALLFLPSGEYFGQHGLFVLYTVFPWCGCVFFGCALGILWQSPSRREQLPRLSAALAVVSGVLFVVLRGLNGFGNLADGDRHGNPANPPLIAFFDLVKYPPSITYTCCYLCINFTILSVVHTIARSAEPSQPFNHKAWQIVLVYGRAPLFYYLLHIWSLSLVRLAIGPQGVSSFYWVYPIWIGVVLFLYLPCSWYGAFKAKTAKESLWRLF